MILRSLALLSALACLPFAAPADAKTMVGTPARFGERASPNYESSQWFAFELKFSPYTPSIDSSPGLGGNRPFLDLFTAQNGVSTNSGARPPARLLTQIEFDFQFFHKFGSLAAGLTIGFYRRTTHSFLYTDLQGTQCQAPNCVRSGDETALNILPITLQLIYRFDVLAQRYRVPLVPYFKIGLAYYMWFIQNGSGGIATYTNPAGGKEDGMGGTFGFVLNPGLAFQLDIIDKAAARTMDTELGINHTYLFCELQYADISGFGTGGKLVLSDLTLNAGIAFEF